MSFENTVYLLSRADLEADLKQALEAVDEIMALDKGPSEEEWVEWCNRNLPLVKKYGYHPFTVEFV